MGKFKVGDRVRFIAPGYNDAQKVGCEAVVVGIDEDGDAIVDTDRGGEFVGWTGANVEVISHASKPVKAAPETIILRDQFAMAALTGILANHEPFSVFGVIERVSDVTANAYVFADSMLAERERAK